LDILTIHLKVMALRLCKKCHHIRSNI